MIKNKIRVLITDDSILFRNVLKNELSKDQSIEIVGMAADPIEAMEKIKLLNPDILTLDIEMPKMDGLTFIKKLMSERPMKVVLVSSMNISVFDALQSGAVDFVRKPDMSSNNDLQSFIQELKTKIKIASIAKLVNYQGLTKAKDIKEEPKKIILTAKLETSKIIAIGASTGGTEAILKILKELPATAPPILITQHMPPGFTKMYAERLNRICSMEVREAADGDRVKKGLALVAPGDKHMRLRKDEEGYYVECKKGEKVSGHCPSVDVLFDSVAEIAGKKAVGIILTGMGKDGASGLMNMKKAGAFTIGQDEKTSVVYGMPMVAYNIGAVQVQAPIDAISSILFKYLNS